MSKLKHLEQRIKDLEQVVAAQKLLIDQLIATRPQPQFTPIHINGTPIRCYDGCVYPSPWMSITPPHCMKCGQQGWSGTITCGDTVTFGGQINTSGYVGVTK
jgi:hypothetical protein